MERPRGAPPSVSRSADGSASPRATEAPDHAEQQPDHDEERADHHQHPAERRQHCQPEKDTDDKTRDAETTGFLPFLSSPNNGRLIKSALTIDNPLLT